MWAQNIYSVTQVANKPYITASGINNRGQAVYSWSCGNCGGGVYYGSFLYDAGIRASLPLGQAAAINSSGQIAGSVFNSRFTDACGQANLYSGGTLTALGFLPGGVCSWSTGINDNGQVAGYSQDSAGTSQAFLYSGGAMTGLGTLPGYVASVANGINNSGQVVGYAQDSSGHKEAFLYSGGAMTDLGTLPGYSGSVATAINDSGQVVGYAIASSGNSRAFLYSDGVMTGLGTLAGVSSSVASAINNKGQIVGSWSGAAFLYTGGQIYDLNQSSVDVYQPLSQGTGINDSGDIIAISSGVVFNLLTPLQGQFVPLAPCRVADTRTSAGPLGGPALDGVSARSFAIPLGACGIPVAARAYSLNVTAVPHGPLSYLTLWPTGMAQPLVSTLNSFEGNVVANAALVPSGQNGALSVYATDSTDVILDINGYFYSVAGDSFYPVQPCRVEDTRRPAGPLGGPAFTAGESRDIPVPSSPCGLPAAATAYSMNATVVPSGFLGFLTTWAAGQPQPFASTLNSWTGKVVANAAIVPAGANGATSVYVTNPTDVILDANGYFAAPGSPGALTFYPVVPCRVADTREADDGPVLAARTTRSFNISESGCGIPSTAAAYALNVTAVPDGPLGFLTAWPAGSPRPLASPLNSWDGTVVANAAIVPAGTDGAVSIYVTNQTHVVLDVNGYFAP